MNMNDVFRTVILLMIPCLFLPVHTTYGQHDAHREAMREITRGEPELARERIHALGDDPSLMWRSLSNAYERAGIKVRSEGEEYQRYVLPENHFVLALLASLDADANEALAQARAAVARGLPFERLLAGPREALAPLYNHPDFQEWARQEARMLLHGPMLGHVTDDAASFWVRTAVPTRVEVRVRAAGESIHPERRGASFTLAELDYTAVVRVHGLKPDTDYTYELLVDGELYPVEYASFRSHPKQGAPSNFRVAFGGGAGFVAEHERMWDTIRERDPVAMLMLGDNVYIDDPEHKLTQHYTYYRRQSRPEWRNMTSSRGTYAIWDDHDFGLNDSFGGPSPDDPWWKPQVWEVFTQNWNNPSYGGGQDVRGVWFDFRVGDVHFIMLDGRYYRESPWRRAQGNENPSMLGPVQLEWLKQTLSGSQATFKVVVSPVPWATGTKGGPPGGYDTWDGFDRERTKIFDLINEHEIDGVVLISADRHRTDARRISRDQGYDLYDFMSSILTNYHTHPVLETDELLFGYNENNSFGLLHFDTAQDDPMLMFEIVNIDNESIWTRELRLSELSH